jgi:hypothetical protein
VQGGLWLVPAHCCDASLEKDGCEGLGLHEAGIKCRIGALGGEEGNGGVSFWLIGAPPAATGNRLGLHYAGVSLKKKCRGGIVVGASSWHQPSRSGKGRGRGERYNFNQQQL